MEDCFNRAFGYTSFAVDALIRMDVKDFVTFVEAFNWANYNAVGVFAPEAVLANYMCHGSRISLNRLAYGVPGQTKCQSIDQLSVYRQR